MTMYLLNFFILYIFIFSYFVFSRADVLGGDAASQGNVLCQARLLQRPAVMGRRHHSPVTDSSFILVFLLLRSLRETVTVNYSLHVSVCEELWSQTEKADVITDHGFVRLKTKF